MNRVIPIVIALATAGVAVGLWTYVLKRGGAEKLRGTDNAVALSHGGNPQAGYTAIIATGCGACHVVPGVPAARGKIGPSLSEFKDRATVAGVLANSAENLARWIRDPRRINPGTAMPNLGVSEDQARDIAAYLLAPR